jgi:hypothetical protein
LGLDYITFAGLPFKYARNTAYRIRGKAEWRERVGLLSEKEPSLNSEESTIPQLWLTDDI